VTRPACGSSGSAQQSHGPNENAPNASDRLTEFPGQGHPHACPAIGDSQRWDRSTTCSGAAVRRCDVDLVCCEMTGGLAAAADCQGKRLGSPATIG
jgi:hypothetical protein